MDYEKKYNEALERAKMILCNISEGERCSDIETIFPELAESEDERARREIIEFIRSQIEDGNSVGWDRWIAYLEKQKEQKPAEWGEEDRRHLDRIQMVLESWDSSHTSLAGLPSTIPDDIDWLKSLRPQPKRDGGDDYNKGYIKGRADTLKEFNDMASWKPSEEQQEVDTKMRTYNKLEMEKLYGEEY